MPDLVHRVRVADQAIVRDRHEVAVERGDDIFELRIAQRKLEREAVATGVDQVRQRRRIGRDDDRNRQAIDFETVQRGSERGIRRDRADECGAPAARRAHTGRFDALHERRESECGERVAEETHARGVHIEHADGRCDVGGRVAAQWPRVDDDTHGIESH